MTAPNMCIGQSSLSRHAAPNNGMHATADTTGSNFVQRYGAAGDLRRPAAARGGEVRVRKLLFIDAGNLSEKGESRAGANKVGEGRGGMESRRQINFAAVSQPGGRCRLLPLVCA